MIPAPAGRASTITSRSPADRARLRAADPPHHCARCGTRAMSSRTGQLTGCAGATMAWRCASYPTRRSAICVAPVVVVLKSARLVVGRVAEWSSLGPENVRTSWTLSQDRSARRRAGRSFPASQRRRGAARRRRHRSLHFPLPQGSHRRTGRWPAAHAGRAPALLARAGRTAWHGAGQHRRTGQADRCPGRADRGRRYQAGLEDLYLPCKKKRRTKAQIAREAGLAWPRRRSIPISTPRPKRQDMSSRRRQPAVEDAKAALMALLILMEQFTKTPTWSASCVNGCGARGNWWRA